MMNRNHFTKTYLFLIICVLFACSQQQQPEDQVLSSVGQVKSDPIAVKTVAATQGNFPLRIITNGTLRAIQKVEIKLQSSGVITHLPIQTGELVTQGSLMAQLDDRALQLQLQQAHLTLEEAEVTNRQRWHCLSR